MNLNDTLANLAVTFDARVSKYSDLAEEAARKSDKLRADSPQVYANALAMGQTDVQNSFDKQSIKWSNLAALNTRRLDAARRGLLLVSPLDRTDPVPGHDDLAKAAAAVDRTLDDQPEPTDIAELLTDPSAESFRIA